jgi:hypothetical protein
MELKIKALNSYEQLKILFRFNRNGDPACHIVVRKFSRGGFSDILIIS